MPSAKLGWSFQTLFFFFVIISMQETFENHFLLVPKGTPWKRAYLTLHSTATQVCQSHPHRAHRPFLRVSAQAFAGFIAFYDAVLSTCGAFTEGNDTEARR
jgi:hypothetical protein